MHAIGTRELKLHDGKMTRFIFISQKFQLSRIIPFFKNPQRA